MSNCNGIVVVSDLMHSCYKCFFFMLLQIKIYKYNLNVLEHLFRPFRATVMLVGPRDMQQDGCVSGASPPSTLFMWPIL